MERKHRQGVNAIPGERINYSHTKMATLRRNEYAATEAATVQHFMAGRRRRSLKTRTEPRTRLSPQTSCRTHIA